ncbi:MAG: 5'/3'-nucleotidase SurE [Phycisphaerales bacterium]|nr:MAG: 5'/3'-nucleotidase SurE [Phycisphaerales bacterium]
MHILICNDDGLDAPGLEALYRACRPLGRVSVVAPAAEQSTTSHTVSLRRPITVRRVRHDVFGRCFAIDGSPADCVRLAVVELLDEAVGFVASGINRGANLGVDTYYSGTVAGAREAAILGLPAVAVSQYVHRGIPVDWERAIALAAPLLKQLADGGKAPDRAAAPRWWNVNLPAPVPGRSAVTVQTVPHSTDPMPMEFARKGEQDDSSLQYEYTGPYAKRVARENTDVSVVFGGDVAITPITVAATEVAYLDVSFRLPLPD